MNFVANILRSYLSCPLTAETGLLMVLGVKLLPKSMTADRDVSVTSMGIVDSDRPERLLNEALIIVLPEPNTVTKAQRAELNRLKGEIRKIRAKDSTFNTAKMAMDGVSAILKDSQRAELIKNNHLHELRTNLNVLSSKESWLTCRLRKM